MERRIRVCGKQREDIDINLLVQALLLIGEDRCRDQEEAAAGRDDTSSGDTPEAAR